MPPAPTPRLLGPRPPRTLLPLLPQLSAKVAASPSKPTTADPTKGCATFFEHPPTRLPE